MPRRGGAGKPSRPRDRIGAPNLPVLASGPMRIACYLATILAVAALVLVIVSGDSQGPRAISDEGDHIGMSQPDLSDVHLAEQPLILPPPPSRHGGHRPPHADFAPVAGGGLPTSPVARVVPRSHGSVRRSPTPVTRPARRRRDRDTSINRHRSLRRHWPWFPFESSGSSRSPRGAAARSQPLPALRPPWWRLAPRSYPGRCAGTRGDHQPPPAARPR